MSAACPRDDGGTQATTPPQPAELQIVQLDEGHTLGGVGETSAGETRSVVIDLKAGTYAWFSGTSPEQEGATPQYRRGGEGSFEVTGDASGAQLPATPAQVTAKELGPTDCRFEASGFKAEMIQEVKVA